MGLHMSMPLQSVLFVHVFTQMALPLTFVQSNAHVPFAGEASPTQPQSLFDVHGRVQAPSSHVATWLPTVSDEQSWSCEHDPPIVAVDDEHAATTPIAMAMLTIAVNSQALPMTFLPSFGRRRAYVRCRAQQHLTRPLGDRRASTRRGLDNSAMLVLREAD
jgi:hypothetical protein